MKYLLLCLLAFVTASAQPDPAELILLNGNVWTGDSLLPRVQAVGVKGGRIIAVGSNEEMLAYRGEHTSMIDAAARLVLPGFIDNHTHFVSGGFQLQNIDLRDAANEEEFAHRIKQRAKRYPGRWMTGGDWDHDAWPGGNLPVKELIDSVSSSTPVFVNRYDGHMALANSYALKLAGITKETRDPPGGTIVRDPLTGEPTGILKDEAMSLVYRIIPAPTREERLEAARRALNEARKLGVTSIQDMSSKADIEIYKKLQNSGELTARFFCRLPISLTESLIKEGISIRHSKDPWVRVGSLKAFADGSLGSSTALFFDPYDSDPRTRGLASDIVLDGRLEKWAMAADRAGLQLSIHAIGDSANSVILDLYEKIVATNPQWERRFRIEHAQHIHPKDFKRFARLNVIASVQPYHAIDDGRWAEGRIGRQRCRTTYAFRSFVAEKVLMCFGSDWTVGQLNPLLGIYAAVTRRTTDGANPDGWFPEQKITVEEAVRAYTSHSAYAAFEENEKGTITPGKFADFVILSDNILRIDPEKIKYVGVDVTVVDGKIVYAKE